VAHELRPGEFTKLFAEVGVIAEVNTREALTAAALAIEREAKLSLSRSGTHKRGTPTPASPGGPPALISGTLRRSVTHTPVRRAGIGIWETKVGLAAGFFPPYGKNRTPSSKYGEALEKGLRNGATFPWLLPAYKVVIPQIRGITVTFFKGPWPKG
jgi:hypothetical protein